MLVNTSYMKIPEWQYRQDHLYNSRALYFIVDYDKNLCDFFQVKWDATSEGFVRPDKVSPWMIEPTEPVRKHTSPLHPSKKMRPLDEVSVLPSIVNDGKYLIITCLGSQFLS